MLLVTASFAKTTLAAGSHYVFAHYMVCFATHGESIQGYEREIQEAQAAGIDGFALNVGAWSGPDTYYKSRVQLIYAAAEQLGTNFKLFFSMDLSNTNDIINILSTYGVRSNSFRYQGKLVVSSYGLQGVDWAGSIFAPLKAQGLEFFFVPHVWPNPVQEVPGYQDAANIINAYSNILNGLFLFGAAGLPAPLVVCNSNYTAAVHAAGLLSMASYTPQYWGCVQYGLQRRYFEFKGGEGTVLQWNSIIQTQPDWVEIVTWNDFNESTYVAPVDGVENYIPVIASPKRYTHRGYLSLSKRYITWFKTGSEPAIDKDALFYSYRTHSWWGKITNANNVPVAWCIGDLEDMIYLTTLLTAPAELHVASGTNQTVYPMSPGVQHVRVPFHEGAQSFALWRSNQPILQVSGPLITNTVPAWDCFPTTDFVTVEVQPPNSPKNLRATSR
jgi:glucan endo-1,3-alpha-glucosidase